MRKALFADAQLRGHSKVTLRQCSRRRILLPGSYVEAVRVLNHRSRTQAGRAGGNRAHVLVRHGHCCD